MKKNHLPNDGNYGGESSGSQARRVLNGLERAGAAGLTTTDLRNRFDVMMPAARIWFLRYVFDKNIQTMWADDFSSGGVRRRIARYVLLPGRWKGAFR